MTIPDVFSLVQAAIVASVPERELQDWDAAGVLQPSISRALPGAPDGMIYSYADLVIANALVRLKRSLGLSDDELWPIAAFLRQSGDLAMVRVFASQNGIAWLADEGGRRLSIAAENASTDGFDLNAIAIELGGRASELLQRTEDELGQITASPQILGNRPVIAGTRIPTDAIWDFHVAGFGVEQIIDEYPRLTRVDIERAIAFEARRRHLQRAS